MTLVESPSLVFQLEPSVYMLMSFLLKVRAEVMAKTVTILEKNDDNQRNDAKNISQGRVKARSTEPSPTVEPCSCPLT